MDVELALASFPCSLCRTVLAHKYTNDPVNKGQIKLTATVSVSLTIY